MTSDNFQNLTIQEEFNPYKECIQGLANEPICVRYTVIKAWEVARSIDDRLDPGEVTLDEIVHRLVINRPRIAVITGSIDHPAHLRDEIHISLAVLRIWQNGGVPFVFGIPVICDGTAQNNIGMSYSLVSRNNTASAVNITFEGHSYHAAYVLSSCDKFPSAVMSGLAAADVARGHKKRGQAPVWAVFIPEHVLKGGTIPKKTRAHLQALMDRAREQGHGNLADDIAENMRYILQCSSDEAFIGQLRRAVNLDLLPAEESRTILNELAAATCDAKGGVCAFNGTGNSSRTLVSALGLTPPDAELLTDAPAAEVVAKGVDMLYRCLNHDEFRITNILGRNFANAVRIHNATGSSSNILLHLPAIMRYAGFDVSIEDYEKVRKETPVPEIFAHSLTEGRDTFVLAQQHLKGQHRGMESLYRILDDLGVAMDLDAPTMTGLTWRERIKGLTEPVAVELGERAVIRTTPTRKTSGVEVLRGNFMSTAVVKLAGMSDQQLSHFDDQLFIIRYYEDEHVCIEELASAGVIALLEQLVSDLPTHQLENILAYNSKGSVQSYDKADFLELVKAGVLSFAFMIAGQGPKAFGMPEMFAPSQNLRHHRLLEGSSLLITDGRYSGVTKGACIGHVTPEAFEGGGIGQLADGDLLWLRIQDQLLDVVDPESLATGTPAPFTNLPQRAKLVADRHRQMSDRLWQIAASNLMNDVSSAEKGCVPYAVDQRAIKKLL
ncbi:MAG: dihydroxy-acid dehydratase [Deltaproteobacteria bacterium]|jgi:dihydroxyacid dehydratase/phosphogluconate dehydratase|nr:dihydroxy-acid dehydratase [Deltaproteobacteria bacterium]